MRAVRTMLRMTPLIALCITCSSCGRSDPFDPPPLAAYVQPSTGGEDVERVCIRQGIEGYVLFWVGDFMPPASGTINPAAREILIHEPTRLDDVTQVGYSPFYSEIRTTLAARGRSNDQGRFRIELPPGTYSVFVREGDLFYANSFSDDGIFLVTVERNRLTSIRFNITYLATF
ncbi:MAG: carboxypeptidase regulatory-like domain-containing protein [Candidatus Latescibacterota bacterium]|nr:MAG: carboxypeptidase regulatory-like domain-containing protein [Candidatus Latescibacterota bacterium]